MIDIISKYLKEGINQHSAINQILPAQGFSKIIIQQFESRVSVEIPSHLETLIVDHDYRLVAEYLAARKTPFSSPLVWADVL